MWKDIRVGDIVHLSNNEMIPADILLLHSSDANGLCFIDTQVNNTDRFEGIYGREFVYFLSFTYRCWVLKIYTEITGGEIIVQKAQIFTPGF